MEPWMAKARRTSSRRISRKRSRVVDSDEESGFGDRPIALTYLLLGLALLAITGTLLIWILRPLPALRVQGFAWLAIPAQSELTTKEVDLTYHVELRPDSAPLVEYDLIVLCGNGGTTIALYLDGLSRLVYKDTRFFNLGHARVVSGRLPEPLGYQSKMQLITGTLVDHPPCKADGVTGSASMTIQGTAIAPLAYYSYSQSEIALPVTGYPWTANTVVNSPPGLHGAWLSPLKSTVSVSVGPLQLQDRIDIGHPPATENGSSLDWSGSGRLSVSAIWTDTAAEQRAQIYIFMLGILGGIGGTLVVEGIEPRISLALQKVAKKLKESRQK
jgi:hypothetical protein